MSAVAKGAKKVFQLVAWKARKTEHWRVLIQEPRSADSRVQKLVDEMAVW